MVKFPMGLVIRQMREYLGMTREELAGTVMTVPNLCKVERGQIVPKPENLEYLCGRLGLSINSMSAIPLDGEMMLIQQLKDDLDISLVDGDVLKAEELISTLKSYEKFTTNKLEKQYLLAAEISLLSKTSGNSQEILEKIEQALRTTHKNFHESTIESIFLSKNEFRLLILLATQYRRIGKTDKAIAVLYGLKNNMDSYLQYDNVEKGKRYPTTIFNLTNALGDMGNERLDEIIELCDLGHSVCLETEHLRMLPNIVFNKAIALAKKEKLAESTKLMKQVYYTCELYNMDAELIKQYALDEGIVLE